MMLGALVHMYPPLHNAGAEHMLHGILSECVRRGHEARVVLSQGRGYRPIGFTPYEHDGVCVSGDVSDLNDCDAVITHLDRTDEAEAWCQAHRKPCVQVFHNGQRPRMAKRCDLAVFNSRWLEEAHGQRFPQRLVVHPPIWADQYRVKSGERVTLINLQKRKGAELFYGLAAAMPDIEFLGVFGAYGVQESPPMLSNLVLLPQQRDIRVAYAQTRVLLMPSEYESYGRCAVEAAVSGIPSIANPTPGLKEALGSNGVFPASLSVDLWSAALRETLAAWDVCSRRAARLGKTLDPAGDVALLLSALEQVIERGPLPSRQGRGTVGQLRYPITISVNCELDGKRYPKGSRIDHDTALALKAAGQLKDTRIN